MKRQRDSDSSDNESNSDDEQDNYDDHLANDHEDDLFTVKQEGNIKEDDKEVPRWIRYLPQRRFLKIPAKSRTASDYINSNQLSEMPTCSRDRADSDMSGSSGVYSVEYVTDQKFIYAQNNSVVNTNSAIEVQRRGNQSTSEAPSKVDEWDGTGDAKKKRKKRRVTFVELVTVDAPILMQSADNTNSTSQMDRSQIVHTQENSGKSNIDGISIMFGENNRSEQKLEIKPSSAAAILEASLLLEFNSISK